MKCSNRDVREVLERSHRGDKVLRDTFFEALVARCVDTFRLVMKLKRLGM